MTPSPPIDLLFGDGTFPLTVPPGLAVDVIRKPVMPVYEDPQAAVINALENPTGGRSLHAQAKSAASACIVICDITRPVPNALFLRPAIDQLRAGGIPSERITVLVATGLHRPCSDEELRTLIGDPWVLEQVRVVNHDAHAAAQLVSLGNTRTRNTPVVLNRLFVEADLRVVTGLVEPHFMAGWSGGRKVIAPGIAGEATIRTFHNAAFMGNPHARSCNLEGNPLHEEQIQIAGLVGTVSAINTVIDETRRLSFVSFGDLFESHAEAVDFVRPYAVVDTPGRYDLVVTSAAGAPLDATYYQTAKGLVGAAEIVKPGGAILLVSSCSEGFGSDAFRDAQQDLVSLGAHGFLSHIAAKPLADIDEWQTQKIADVLQQDVQVSLYTQGLQEPDWAQTAIPRCPDPAATLHTLAATTPAARVAVIPEGPYVVPRVSP